MSKTLNFNNVAKQYLTVILADEKNTTLLVMTPTKALLRELQSLNTDFNTDATGDDFGAVDELYSVCAKALSRNKGGIKITKEYLEEIFDFEDLLIFVNEYTDFIGKTANRKN